MHIKRLRFKKAIRCFIALSLFFVLIPSYGSGWRVLENSAKRSDFYQIMPSDQDSQYLKVWWWRIFRDKIEDTPADNVQTFYEVDCKNHCARPLHSVLYNEAELVGQSPLNEDWVYGVPDSIHDLFIRIVCNKLPNHLIFFFKPVEVDVKRELSSLRGNEDHSAIEEKLAKGKWFLANAKKLKIDEQTRVTIKFFDKASLRINKQYRQILSWSLLTNPSSVTPLAIVSSQGFLEEYDCDKQRFRISNTFVLYETGQLIRQPSVSEWQIPNHFSYIDLFCKYKNKFSATPVTVDFRTIKTIPEEWLVEIDE